MFLFWLLVFFLIDLHHGQFFHFAEKVAQEQSGCPPSLVPTPYRPGTLGEASAACTLQDFVFASQQGSAVPQANPCPDQRYNADISLALSVRPYQQKDYLVVCQVRRSLGCRNSAQAQPRCLRRPIWRPMDSELGCRWSMDRLDRLAFPWYGTAMDAAATAWTIQTSQAASAQIPEGPFSSWRQRRFCWQRFQRIPERTQRWTSQGRQRPHGPESRTVVGDDQYPHTFAAIQKGSDSFIGGHPAPVPGHSLERLGGPNRGGSAYHSASRPQKQPAQHQAYAQCCQQNWVSTKGFGRNMSRSCTTPSGMAQFLGRCSEALGELYTRFRLPRRRPCFQDLTSEDHSCRSSAQWLPIDDQGECQQGGRQERGLCRAHRGRYGRGERVQRKRRCSDPEWNCEYATGSWIFEAHRRGDGCQFRTASKEVQGSRSGPQFFKLGRTAALWGCSFAAFHKADK